MNKQRQVVTLQTKETIDDQAAKWLAKLDGGNLSVEERHEFQEWLRKSPKHAEALKCFATVWGDMDTLLNSLPSDDILQNDSDSRLSFFSSKWQVPLVLTVICVSVIILFFSIDTPPNKYPVTEASSYSTNIGIQKKQKFSDGSTAHLNTNSIIETEYNNSSRIVRLVQGEAMFNVVHDPDRPFIVYVGNTRVKAIGTSFIVRLKSENIIVTVIDGKIELEKNRINVDSPVNDDQEQQLIILNKGEEIELYDNYVAHKTKKIKDEEVNRRLSWMQDQLVFKDETLEYVVEEISRYVPVRIIIKDSELRDVKISGRFQFGDTVALLEAIELSLNVHVSYIDDQTIHLSR